MFQAKTNARLPAIPDRVSKVGLLADTDVYVRRADWPAFRRPECRAPGPFRLHGGGNLPPPMSQ